MSGQVLDKVIHAILLIAFCSSVAISSFFNFCLYYIFLSFVEFQPALFFCCSNFLRKSQPDLSYKGC